MKGGFILAGWLVYALRYFVGGSAVCLGAAIWFGACFPITKLWVADGTSGPDLVLHSIEIIQYVQKIKRPNLKLQTRNRTDDSWAKTILVF